jgi:hypothetical protein
MPYKYGTLFLILQREQKSVNHTEGDMSKRNPIPRQIFQALYKRDNEKCRKCGRMNSLECHHIIAVMDGGSDNLDNLILLCWPCHREWEVIEALNTVEFDVWLEIPPMLLLFHIFVHGEWKAGDDMDEARRYIIMRNEQLRESGWGKDDDRIEHRFG